MTELLYTLMISNNKPYIPTLYFALYVHLMAKTTSCQNSRNTNRKEFSKPHNVRIPDILYIENRMRPENFTISAIHKKWNFQNLFMSEYPAYRNWNFQDLVMSEYPAYRELNFQDLLMSELPA